MKTKILLIFIGIILIGNSVYADVTLAQYNIQSLYLSSNKLRVTSGKSTSFIADFTFNKVGERYNTVEVYLVHSDNNSNKTVLSSSKWIYNGEWRDDKQFSWSGTLNGILPAGKINGNIYLEFKVWEGSTSGGTRTSGGYYELVVTSGGGSPTTPPTTPPVNPFPGSVIIDNWITVNKDRHSLAVQGVPVFSKGYGYVESHAFRAFANSDGPGNLIPIYKFEGSYGNNSYTYLFGTGTNVDPFWKKYDEIPFYAFGTQVPGSLPVYCYTNAQGRNHYFSIHDETDPYWRNKYIAFYAYPVN